MRAVAANGIWAFHRQEVLTVITISLPQVELTLYTMLQPNLSTKKPPSADPSLEETTYRQNQII